MTSDETMAKMESELSSIIRRVNNGDNSKMPVIRQSRPEDYAHGSSRPNPLIAAEAIREAFELSAQHCERVAEALEDIMRVKIDHARKVAQWLRETGEEQVKGVKIACRKAEQAGEGFDAMMAKIVGENIEGE